MPDLVVASHQVMAAKLAGDTVQDDSLPDGEILEDRFFAVVQRRTTGAAAVDSERTASGSDPGQRDHQAVTTACSVPGEAVNT
ncbi:MAG TPA: hypothetical protein VEB65_04525, partial [Solirubrobacterales bacterium]|nr:hypothetical protein [Solirubrobacterales bacterium]